MNPHTSPYHHASGFNCPHCGIYSQQKWQKLETLASLRSRRAQLGVPCSENGDVVGPQQEHPVVRYDVSVCSHCEDITVWHDGKMVFPEPNLAPPPHDDMPSDVRREYVEAASILAKSPKGAAALLRLALQQLMKHLGRPGKNINEDIGGLVKEGLPIEIQQACDAVRLIGNDAVHPGAIDWDDTPEMAHILFGILNLIVDSRISQPQKISNLYDSFPEAKRRAVDKRDGK